MLRSPFRSAPSGPKAVLIGIVATMSVLGGLSWTAMTAFDFTDTLERAEQSNLLAASMIAGQAETILRSGARSLDHVVGRLEAGGGLASLAESVLGEALSLSELGSLSILDTAGDTRYGPTVALDREARALLQRSLVPAPDREGAEDALVLPGQTEDGESVVLGRRIAGRDGRIQGMALLAMPSAQLTTVSRAFDGLDRTAGLFRPDGTRLAGHGVNSLGPLPALPPGGRGVERDWPVQDRAFVLGLRRMHDLPVLTAVAIPRAVVLAPWRSRLDRGAAMALTSALALLGLAWVGWTSQRREADARRALEGANIRLEQRVEERTADLRGLNRKLVKALEDKGRADQAKTRFLSAANHDLRQPFQALRLFHHILMERLVEPRDREVAERMGEALDSGETLLHALLEVATLDAGVVQPTFADVPVAGLLEEVASEFRDAAAAKGLQLRVRPGRAVLRTDRTLLARTLRELIRNAVAYTETGGVTIGCRRRGSRLRVEVWDTGPGIAPEHLDSIFEDFVQLGNPERDRSRGLGLGLAKVRRKAALLGLGVEVRSRVGQGSFFAVSVPAAAAPPAPAPARLPSAEPDEAERPRLILVVEDDPVQRSGMQMLLEGWGHRVMAAADGEAALGLLRTAQPPPDVIVSDFRLPGELNGVQIVACAGELLDHPVPGIILTGDTAPARIREAVATGCRLLHKPFTPDRLREALADAGRAVRRRRQSAA